MSSHKHRYDKHFFLFQRRRNAQIHRETINVSKLFRAVSLFLVEAKLLSPERVQSGERSQRVQIKTSLNGAIWSNSLFCSLSGERSWKSASPPPSFFTQLSHATTFHIILMNVLRLHVCLHGNVACMSVDVHSVTASLHHICLDRRQKIKKNK